MIKVLFVCLGNICRSPMAEAMFRDLVKQEGLDHLIEVDSAGTGSWHIGKAPHEGTRKILDKYNISYEGMKARQIEKLDLHHFDYIIGMDEENMNNIHNLQNEQPKGFTSKLLDLNEQSKIKDVPDPYYTGNFDETYELIKEGNKALLELIKKEHGLMN